MGLSSDSANLDRETPEAGGYLGQIENVKLRDSSVISLRNTAPSSDLSPEFSQLTLLPGRGMSTHQIRAFLPGRGEIDLLVSPDLKNGPNSLGPKEEDLNGNLTFKSGGAFLIPFANRICGEFLPGSRQIETKILEKKTLLPANWIGKNPGATPHSMHGLVLKSNVDSFHLSSNSRSASVEAVMDAGNFSGHWASKTFLSWSFSLNSKEIQVEVTAENRGNETLPLGIGWHPYFLFPSGNRERVKIHIPARKKLKVTNYDDVFPTGESALVAGTEYDFSVPGGKELGKLYLDDCFVDLVRNQSDEAIAEIIDSDAGYGLRIKVKSPLISAFQAYAPIDQPFIALEPQFNWPDPFNSQIWKNRENTGMAQLQSGERARYAVSLELFTPDKTPSKDTQS